MYHMHLRSEAVMPVPILVFWDVTSLSLVWHVVVLQEMLLLLTHKNIFDFDSMDRAVLATKMHRFCPRYKLLALCLTLAIGHHLLGVQLVRSLKSNVYMAVTTYQHRKYWPYFKCCRHTCTLAEYVFNWNTSVIGDENQMVWLPLHHHYQC